MGLFSSPAKSKTVSGEYPDLVWQEQSPFLTQNFQAAQDFTNKQMDPGSQFQASQQALYDSFNNALQGSNNPYTQGMAQSALNQVSKQFQEQIMPALLGGGNNAGQLGSERYQQLQNSAVDTATRTMGDVANEIYGRQANIGIASQGNALQNAQQVASYGYTPLLAQSNILGSPLVMDQGNYSWSKSQGASGGIIGDIANLAGAATGLIGGTSASGATSGITGLLK